jgi:soluble lytic murein transglycosylase-like protein
MHAVLQVESGGNPWAKSPAGAVGPMQMMPKTARAFGAKDPTDPVQNIQAAGRFLGHLWTKYKGNIPLILAAYNAGEPAVDHHRGVPPYKETMAYVRKAMNLLRA